MDETEDAALRNAVLVLAVGVGLYGGYCLFQLPAVLDEMGRVPRMTCDDLARNGPGGHRYVVLTDARLSAGPSVSERDGDTGAVELFHPVYPAGAGREPDPRDFRHVLAITDETERRRVRDDRNARGGAGLEGLSEMTCGVEKSDALPTWARNGLMRTYPNIRPDDCWVVTLKGTEPTPAYARRLALHGTAWTLAAAGLLLLRRRVRRTAAAPADRLTPAS